MSTADSTVPTRPLPDVRVGQVWADNDPRIPHGNPRYLRVETITDFGGGPVARCVRVAPIHDGRGVQTGWAAQTKTTTGVQVRRFRPTSTGYRLVQDVEVTR